MEWEVNKGNPDAERRQLNRVLDEIQDAVGGLATAVQPGDNVSVLVNDAGYITESEATDLIDASATPTYIQPAETFTVPEFAQVLWTEDIVIDGTMEVIGTLVEVT